MRISAIFAGVALAIAIVIFVRLPAWASNPLAGDFSPAMTHYQALPLHRFLTGAVGEKIILSFALEPPKPPPGYFVAVNMKALKEPKAAKTNKPQILTGFPETSAVFRVPGVYRYSVVVSLVTKSSCGGTEANTLFRGVVRIDIHS